MDWWRQPVERGTSLSVGHKLISKNVLNRPTKGKGTRVDFSTYLLVVCDGDDVEGKNDNWRRDR